MPNRFDDFNRADGPLIGSTPSDGGSPWVRIPTATNTGSWSVVGNQARDAQSSGDKQRFVALDSGADDFELTCAMAVIGTNTDGGFFFRSDGGLRGYLFAIRGSFTTYHMQLYRWFSDSDDGNGTSIWQSAESVVSGDVIKIRAEGSLIQIYKNDVLKDSRTDTHQTTGTYHGFRNYSDSTATRWDSLVITDLSIPSTPTSRQSRIVTGGNLGPYGILTGGNL